MCKRITLFISMLIVFIILQSASQLQSQVFTDEYGYIAGGNYVLGGLGSSSAFLNIPHNAVFNQSSQGSLEMWIYPMVGNTSQVLISKGSTSSQSFLFGITNQILYFNIGTVNFNNTGGIAIQYLQWTHVAVTWAYGGTYFINFYVNGSASGSTVSGNAVWNLNSDPVRIGASQFYLGQAFNGKIDEVRFWNTVRTASQFSMNRFTGIGDASNANAGNAITAGVNYTGLISSWTFNHLSVGYDYIGGNHGTYVGGAMSVFQNPGVPIPYNLALRLSNGPLDYVIMPSNSAFNQVGDGTIEMWVKPLSLSTDQTLISKGASGNTITFLFGITSAGKLLFRTGSNPVASNGPSVVINRWNHVAVTWSTSGGGPYNIKFYLNGEQNGTDTQIPNVFPINSNNVWLGNSQALSNTAFNGYIDELRLWNTPLALEQIRRNLFVSGRTLLTNTEMFAMYNFDGNLNNHTSTSGLNASLNNGGANNSRLSGYINETSLGAYPVDLISHTSVINRGGTPNSYPIGFNNKVTYLPVPDNNPTGITDTIDVTYPAGNLFSIEVFVSIEHTYVNDMIVSLKAPNGTTKNLLNRNGGSYDNVLSFFGDVFPNSPNSPQNYPPWAFVKPIEAMGSFNGSTMDGKWVLRVVDAATGDAGVLKGWGIRLNNSVNIQNTGNEISDKFSLSQNYPNPFNPVTNIKFDLAKSLNVKITLFDILGREILVLANEYKQAGSYNLSFDGSSLASGTYFYKLEAGEFTDVKKMVLMK